MKINSLYENMEDEVLVSEEELKQIVERLGEEITKDYEGKDLLLVCILKGSVIFMADLMRAIKVPCRIDFMAVSSYGDKKESSGEVKIIKDLDYSLAGKDLLIVEDILDSGRTLAFLRNWLSSRNPNSIKICTLIDKPDRHAKDIDIKADYVGCHVPDKFIVGYGLDYDEYYRNLPFIGVVK